MDNKKLSYEELDALFEEVKSGEKCVIVEGRVFILRYPTQEDLDYCKRIQQIYTLKFKGSSPTSDEIPQYLGSEGKSLDIESLEKQQYKLKRVVEDKKIIENEQSLLYYSKELSKVSIELNQAKKITEQSESMERFALDKKIRDYIYYYMLRNCVYHYTRPNSVEKFFNESIQRYSHWSSKLLQPFLEFYIGNNDKIMRQLSRHGRVASLWKISCNTGSGFFRGSSSEYTPLQVKLCFWLSYYGDVYKNLGAPDSDTLVEDDQAFDDWVKNKVKEMKNKKRLSKAELEKRIKEELEIFCAQSIKELSLNEVFEL